jgi:hypothetical protein
MVTTMASDAVSPPPSQVEVITSSSAGVAGRPPTRSGWSLPGSFLRLIGCSV